MCSLLTDRRSPRRIFSGHRRRRHDGVILRGDGVIRFVQRFLAQWTDGGVCRVQLAQTADVQRVAALEETGGLATGMKVAQADRTVTLGHVRKALVIAT
jgi:hypothetical protein